jgi:hypothetical protein
LCNVSQLEPMTSLNFRAFIPLLIGIMASLIGLVTVSALRQRRCVDSGGVWEAANSVCALESAPLDVSHPMDIFAGVAVAALLAFMLHRASTFAARHRTSVQSP